MRITALIAASAAALALAACQPAEKEDTAVTAETTVEAPAADAAMAPAADAAMAPAADAAMAPAADATTTTTVETKAE